MVSFVSNIIMDLTKSSRNLSVILFGSLNIAIFNSDCNLSVFKRCLGAHNVSLVNICMTWSLGN